MGAPQRNLVITIQRPPFYRPPRHRPVTFADSSSNNITTRQADNRQYGAAAADDTSRWPANSGGVTLTTGGTTNAAAAAAANRAWAAAAAPKSAAQTMMEPTGRLGDSSRRTQGYELKDHNRSPRPFSRRDLVQAHAETIGRATTSSGPPRTTSTTNQFAHINRPLPASDQPKQQLVATTRGANYSKATLGMSYPTSTVHKSMLNTRAKGVESHGRRGGAPTTTIMTTRDEPTSTARGQTSADDKLSELVPNKSISHTAPIAAAAAAATTNWPNSPGNELTSGPRQQQPRQQFGQLEAEEQSNYAGRPRRQLVEVEQYQGLPSKVAGRKREKSNRLSSGGCVGGGCVLPDTKEAEYMHSKRLERAIIAHQTYRTLPIVLPSPKARHDLANGTYMRYNQDPTFELAFAGQPSRRWADSGATWASTNNNNNSSQNYDENENTNKHQVGRQVQLRDNREQRLREAISSAPSGEGGRKVGIGEKQQAIDSGKNSSHTGPEQQQPLVQQGPQYETTTTTAAAAGAGSSSMPAFNYREYIELTRRAT